MDPYASCAIAEVKLHADACYFASVLPVSSVCTVDQEF